MKYNWFLVGFSIISLLTISIIPITFAQTEFGVSYDDTVIQVLEDGREVHEYKPLRYERILDNNVYKDFIFTETSEFLQVETEGASVQLIKSSGEFKFYKNGKIITTPLLEDDIVPFQSVNGTGVWNVVNSIDDASVVTSWNGSELKATKTSGVGTVEYVYILVDGKWKTELRVKNTSGLNNRLFGFEQNFNLNRDTIRYGGVTINLDNLDGLTFDRAWIENNESQVIDVLNGHKFDFDIGLKNLSEITITDTGINSSLLTFQYFHNQNVLLDGATLVIDPTYTSTTGTLIDGYVQDATLDNTCTVSDGTKVDSTQLYVGLNTDATIYQECWLSYIEIDISPIDDSATITDVSLTWNNGAFNGARGDDYVALETVRTTDTASTIFDQILTGGTTVFLNAYTGCDVTALCSNVDLGTDADQDVQDHLTLDYWGFGVRPDNLTMDSSAHSNTFDSETGTTAPEITITYVTTIAPNAVDDLTSTAIGTTFIDLDWTQPNLNGESLVGYQINYTTPQSTTVRTLGTVFLNDTGVIDDTVTGLTGGTDYSFTVSAWTIGGNNATFANVYNATTLSGASTPTGLTATDTSISTIDVDWNDAPAYDNITGFRIFRESPTGNGWTLHTNDTGTTTSFLGDTGLSTKTQYNYMIAGINATGIGSNSTAAAATTYGVPDAITDLSLGATASTMILTWSAPTVYGFPITGYMIEYESPVGNGYVTLVADTGTTDVTYTHTGLASFTEYGYRVTAISSFGNSATSNEPSAFTVTDAPVLDIVNDCYHTCTTQLNLEFTAPTGTVTGYKIEHDLNSAGYAVLVANTTNTNVVYNATGYSAGDIVEFRVSAHSAFGTSAASNAKTYSTHALPDAVDDLIATASSLSSIDLSWSLPTINSHVLSCYNINYTTPILGSPLTVITACTPTTGTTYQITGLALGDPNSFRVSAVTPHGSNGTGNIINATAFSEFTIGSISIDEDPNPLSLDVLYDQVDTGTTSAITVRFPNTVTNMTCNLAYSFAQTNTNYTNLTPLGTYDASYDSYTFTLNNSTNEIVDFDCYDASDITINGQYTKPQSAFPFIDMADSFRDGTFGTTGEIGGMDMITLIVIIVSMVGFNKQNPAAGLIIAMMILGATSYFGLIELPTMALGAIALVVMLGIVITRK